MSDRPRVRFAPSPTGSVHVGHAHTSLFNWLFARHHGGAFVLRIEDTDEVRSTKASRQAIYDGLHWLGIDWDEGPDVGGPYGPYEQSERLEIYEEYYQKLLGSGRAYPCYCSPEELEERRQAMRALGLAPRYDNRCRDLTEAQRSEFQAQGRRPALRLRMKDAGTTVVHDLIRGDVPHKNSLIGDVVIRKASEYPTYHFAVVIDDYLMEITHVIRAEEHLPNTVPHLQLMEALEIPPPQYAHLGLLMGHDRTKLSSRHGAVDLAAYREMGILPQAMVNFMALLGWSTGTNEEVLSVEEIIERFGLDHCSKSPSVFDMEKCEWLNGQHIRRAPMSQLVEIAHPILVKAGLIGKRLKPERREWLERVIDLMRDRVRTLSALADWGAYFFTENYEYNEEARAKWLRNEGTPETLDKLAQALGSVQEWNVGEIESAVRGVAEEMGVGGGKAIHPCRAAVTGTTVGPSLFHLLELLPKETVVERLERTAERCRSGEFARPGPGAQS